MVSPSLLTGLKLQQPQSLLFPSNYVTALTQQTPDTAWLVVGVAVLLLFLGLPLRRATAAVCLGGVAWFVAGALAMSAHWPFALTTMGAAFIFAALGAFRPRLALALATSLPLSLCVRSLALYFLPEWALWAMLGGMLVVWAVAWLFYRLWTAVSAAALGAFLITFSLPVFLAQRFVELSPAGVSEWIVLYVAIFMVMWFMGMAVQMRLGEWSLPRRVLAKKA